MAIEYFIRESDNQIKLTLTEDGTAIFGAWTAIDIHIGSKIIHRDADGNGVSLDTSTGLLTISPGDLTTDEQEDIALLPANRLYRTRIIVTSTLNDDGAVFGGSGADPLYFHISDKILQSSASPI